MRTKLKKIRLSRELTQEEMANQLGIDRATYTNIELGNRNPSLKVALKMKKILNYNNDDIFLRDKCLKGTGNKNSVVN